MSETNGCEWIAAPSNPARNLIYAGVSYLAFKGVAAEALKQRKNFAKLKAKDRAHLLFDLTAYMYNGGDGGIRQAFEVYMDENSETEMTYEAFRKGFQVFLAANFGEGLPYFKKHPKELPRKRAEVAGYVAGIESRLKQVEKKAGVKCSL